MMTLIIGTITCAVELTGAYTYAELAVTFERSGADVIYVHSVGGAHSIGWLVQRIMQIINNIF